MAYRSDTVTKGNLAAAARALFQAGGVKGQFWHHEREVHLGGASFLVWPIQQQDGTKIGRV